MIVPPRTLGLVTSVRYIFESHSCPFVVNFFSEICGKEEVSSSRSSGLESEV